MLNSMDRRMFSFFQQVINDNADGQGQLRVTGGWHITFFNMFDRRINWRRQQTCGDKITQ